MYSFIFDIGSCRNTFYHYLPVFTGFRFRRWRRETARGSIACHRSHGAARAQRHRVRGGCGTSSSARKTLFSFAVGFIPKMFWREEIRSDARSPSKPASARLFGGFCRPRSAANTDHTRAGDISISARSASASRMRTRRSAPTPKHRSIYNHSCKTNPK